MPPERPQELCGEPAGPAGVIPAAIVVGHSRVHVQGRLVLRRVGTQGALQDVSPSPPVFELLVPGHVGLVEGLEVAHGTAVLPLLLRLFLLVTCG